MSYYILIRGPLGVGKSTIAKKLANKLEGYYILMDDVLAKHGLDKVPPQAKCIPVENFIKADKLILPEARNYLQRGKVVVFDACFYHKTHIEHILQNLDFPHYAFTLKAPLKVCIGRDCKRNKVYGKEAAAAVHNLVSRFDYGIVIDTSKLSIAQTVKKILSHLPESERF
jgi:predicted kinase